MVQYVVIILVCTLFDQASKFLVYSQMQLGQTIPLLGDWLRLYYTLNEGAGFSILQGQRWFLVGLTIVILTLITIYCYKLPREEKWFRFLLAVFVGGALGNFIDRVFRGAVVDFIAVGSFPVFNVADCCITVAAVLLCIYIIYQEVQHKRKKIGGDRDA